MDKLGKKESSEQRVPASPNSAKPDRCATLAASSEELRRAIRSMFKTVGVEVFVCKANGWDARLVGPPSEARNLEIEFQKFIAELRRDFHLVENRSAAKSTMKPAD